MSERTKLQRHPKRFNVQGCARNLYEWMVDQAEEGYSYADGYFYFDAFAKRKFKIDMGSIGIIYPSNTMYCAIRDMLNIGLIERSPDHTVNVYKIILE